jgi:predicted nucleotidyltransferase
VTINIEKTISIMIETFLARYGQEVDLIIQYGSLVTGDNHEASDIDISWVPVHEGRWESITIEVQGILVDLYAIPWPRLREMAEFENYNCTILERHRILHSRDDAARERISSLLERYRALQRPEARTEMLEKSFGLFQRAAYPSYLIGRAAARGEVMDCVAKAQELSDILSHCLMTLNQRSIDTRKDAEVIALPKLPADFAGLRDALARSRDSSEIKRKADEIMEATRSLLLSEQSEVCREEPGFAAAAGNNNFPETANGLRHAAREARRRNITGLNRDLCCMLREIRNNIGRGISGRWFHDFNALSELTRDIPGMDLSGLSNAMLRLDWEELEKRLLGMVDDMAALYREKRTGMNSFGNMSELEAWLKKG